jgi:hypothetical protein
MMELAGLTTPLCEYLFYTCALNSPLDEYLALGLSHLRHPALSLDTSMGTDHPPSGSVWLHHQSHHRPPAFFRSTQLVMDVRDVWSHS